MLLECLIVFNGWTGLESSIYYLLIWNTGKLERYLEQFVYKLLKTQEHKFFNSVKLSKGGQEVILGQELHSACFFWRVVIIHAPFPGSLNTEHPVSRWSTGSCARRWGGVVLTAAVPDIAWCPRCSAFSCSCAGFPISLQTAVFL